MYHVWTKEEYADQWTRTDARDLEEARTTILQAVQTGREPLLTQEVPFSVEVKVRPVKEPEPPPPRKERELPKIEVKMEDEHEVEESQPAGYKGPGGKGHRQV